MRRRKFITLLGGTAAAWPLAVRAQQPAIPVIGFLHGGTPHGDAGAVVGIREGLKEAAFIENDNVAIEYRWAENHYERLAALAADLVRRQVAVIVVGGGSAAAQAAKAATSTVPIVLAFGSDPVELGLAASLSHPGGNVTGVILSGEFVGKRLELLCELVPQATTIAYLRTGPQRSNVVTEQMTTSAVATAHVMRRQLLVLKVDGSRDIDAAFATLINQQAGALAIAAHPFFDDDEINNQLATLTLRHAIPAIYQQRAFPAAGGLMSYGASYAEGFRQAGIYIGRILKGEKAADLPFEQSTKVELIINLKTAKTLGLAVPIPLLRRADEVIE
jgi:putative tryptophan/tyrosine transport system substrate-binding protein